MMKRRNATALVSAKAGSTQIIRRSLQAPDAWTMARVANTLVNARLWGFIRPRAAKYPISKNALKVMALLSGRVDSKKDLAFAEFHVTATELYQRIGIRRAPPHEVVVGLLDELASYGVWFRSEPGAQPGRASWHRVSWFDKQPRYEEADGRIILRLSDDLKPYLLQQERYYTQHYIQSIVALDSVDAIKLYEYLRQFAKLRPRPHRVNVQELCDVLGFRRVTDWWLFDQDHLRPAINQIMERTELVVLYKPVRMGRTDRKRGPVDEIIFHVGEDQAVLAKRQADEDKLKSNKPKAGLMKAGLIALRPRLQSSEDGRVLTGVKDGEQWTVTPARALPEVEVAYYEPDPFESGDGRKTT